MIEIPVSRGKYVALIDDEDYGLVSQYKWRGYKGGDPGKNGTFYAQAHRPMVNGIDQGNVIMHRLIKKAPKGVKVDHWDGNGLNNQKLNLRLATDEQNQQNRKNSVGYSSDYKGVALDKRHGTWKAQIRFDGKSIWLGQFKHEVDAARAYDTAARKLFGEFAKCNFNNV